MKIFKIKKNKKSGREKRERVWEGRRGKERKRRRERERERERENTPLMVEIKQNISK